MGKEKILVMVNKAVELEHAARIQYLAHAEQVEGINAEPVIARLKEIAGDEAKHESMFSRLVGDFLGGVPSMGIAETHSAGTVEEILQVNLKAEKEAVEFYSDILKEINESRQELPYEFLTLEHDVRHVIIDEQEHIAEIKILLGMR